MAIAMAMPPGRYSARLFTLWSVSGIGGFIQSHYMPPSGVCLRRISPVDAMVIAVAGVQQLGDVVENSGLE